MSKKEEKPQTTFDRIVEDLSFLSHLQVKELKNNNERAAELAWIMFNRTMDTLKALWREREER